MTASQRNGGVVGAAAVAGIGASGIRHSWATQRWSATYGVTALALTLFLGGALGFGMGVSAVDGASWLGSRGSKD